MHRPLLAPAWCLAVIVVAAASGSMMTTAPDWFRIVRTVMMALGGLVVIAIVLIVGVAIVSGVMGMIGKLRRGP